MHRTLRRPHRHGAGRVSPAAAGLGTVPVLHGPEPLEPADRPGVGPRRIRCAGHDGATAPRLGCQDRARAAGGRGGDRRGLRRGRAQGPTRGGGQGGRLGRRRRLAGAPGRGTRAKDKPSILGLIERGGQVVLRMLANVQQITIEPIIEATVAKGALVHTDEYGIYARLEGWGYQHKTVCHAQGEYARDEDSDGFCERCTSTPSRVSGPCCAPGSARTAVSRRTSCRSTSGSSSSCTTHAVAAEP